VAWQHHRHVGFEADQADTSSLCRAGMHGAAALVRRAVSRGASKSVRFEKKINVKIKFCYKTVLKNLFFIWP
jgi:hypothetical protein